MDGLRISKMLVETKANTVYAKLERFPDSFGLASFDANDFTLSDHEKEYEKLASFAYGNTNDASVKSRLRPFMERYIDLRYQPDLRKHDLVNLNLNDKINRLKMAEVFTSDIATQLHLYREALNPEHHDYSMGVAIEDDRALVKNVIEYLYSL